MQLVTLDFETYYSKAFSLSKLTTEEYVRSPEFETIGVSLMVGAGSEAGPCRWITGDDATIKAALDEIDWASTALLCHNTMFDAAILSWRYDIHPATLLDTLSMARPHTGMTVGGSLKALAVQYGVGVKGTEVLDALGKHRADFTPADLAQYGEYCRNDTAITYKLFLELLKVTPPRELRLIDQAIRMFTEPKLVLDDALLLSHLASVQRKKSDLLDRVSDSCGGASALMSNPQLADALRALGVEPPMKNSPAAAARGETKLTYAFAKSDKEFSDLLEHDNPEVQAIVAARLGVKSTLEETRTLRLIGIAERGALPVPLMYYGALVSGRMSGTGGKINLQNMPRGGAIRRAVMAPPGYVVVAADSANIELRVNHTLAGQVDSVESFRHGRDLYCEFASVLFGRDITKADKAERQLGKLAHLSLGYGCGPERFQQICRLNKVLLTEERAREVVKLWRATYACIPAQWRACDAVLASVYHGDEATIGGLVRAESEGLRLPSGRMIRYPGLTRASDGWEYVNRRVAKKLYGAKVVENICQSLAADIINDQLLAIAKRYSVVLQVHDEIVFLAPEAEADEAAAFAVGVMSASPRWWPGIPLAAEAAAASRYGDAK